VDKVEDKALVNIKGVEEAHTKEINTIEETKEQDFSRKDTMSTIS